LIIRDYGFFEAIICWCDLLGDGSSMIAGFLLAIFIGLTLGLIGSGGTILTVPIFVYVMGVDPVMATTYALFAVGVTSVVGAVRGFANSEIDIKQACRFGIPSLLTVYLTRTFLLPLVPETIHFGSFEIHQSVLLMIFFALIMFAAALSMIVNDTSLAEYPITGEWSSELKTKALGVAVGLITGVVGAGGGFLIVPALISLLKLPLRKAVSTSLLIISVNSLFGLLGDIEKVKDFDWLILCGYTFFAIIGIFVGFLFSKKIDGSVLKTVFAYLILCLSIYILFKELFLIF